VLRNVKMENFRKSVPNTDISGFLNFDAKNPNVKKC